MKIVTRQVQRASKKNGRSGLILVKVVGTGINPGTLCIGSIERPFWTSSYRVPTGFKQRPGEMNRTFSSKQKAIDYVVQRHRDILHDML